MIGFNNNFFKEDYKVTGVKGSRVAWGLGGKFDLFEIIAGPLSIDDGCGSVFSTFAALPGSGEFHTAMVPDVVIDPIPKMVDVNDVDGDGDTDELVPDYDDFPELPGGDMVLKVPLDRRLTVEVGELPPDGSGGWLCDGVLIFAGVVVRGAGFVPLGYGAGDDDPCGLLEHDGRIDEIELPVSDVAGRLPEGSYERVVVALALSFARLMDRDDTVPMVIAGQVHFVDGFEGTLTLKPFMEPADFAFDAESRRVDISAVPEGTDYLHMLLSSDAGSWQVLHPGTTGVFDLPAEPAAGDRADGMGVVAVRLADGVGYQDLIAFDDANMGDLVMLVSEFAIVYADGDGGWDCDCAGGASRGGLWGIAALLLGLVVRRAFSKD